jgi:hypothetical protein
MGFRQWIFSMREYLDDYIKIVGFGHAARTRLFRLIYKQNMALCAPLHSAHHSFAVPLLMIIEKTLLIVAKLLL